MIVTIAASIAAVFAVQSPMQNSPDNEKAPCRSPRSPPAADKPSSMQRSMTLDGDYFERRELRIICTQKFVLDDFLPQENEIIPNLYLCDLYTATSPKVHERLEITHVLSAVRDPWFRFPPPVQHMNVPIDDNRVTNLLCYLDAAVAWLHRALLSSENARVLVHCVWGMSRSASIVVAYLISKHRMSLDSALAWVRLKRVVVRPNHGFMAQLEVYEQQTRQRERTRLLASLRRNWKVGDVHHLEHAGLTSG